MLTFSPYINLMQFLSFLFLMAIFYVLVCVLMPLVVGPRRAGILSTSQWERIDLTEFRGCQCRLLGYVAHGGDLGYVVNILTRILPAEQESLDGAYRKLVGFSKRLSHECHEDSDVTLAAARDNVLHSLKAVMLLTHRSVFREPVTVAIQTLVARLMSHTRLVASLALKPGTKLKHLEKRIGEIGLATELCSILRKCISIIDETARGNLPSSNIVSIFEDVQKKMVSFSLGYILRLCSVLVDPTDTVIGPALDQTDRLQCVINFGKYSAQMPLGLWVRFGEFRELLVDMAAEISVLDSSFRPETSHLNFKSLEEASLENLREDARHLLPRFTELLRGLAQGNNSDMKRNARKALTMFLAKVRVADFLSEEPGQSILSMGNRFDDCYSEIHQLVRGAHLILSIAFTGPVVQAAIHLLNRARDISFDRWRAKYDSSAGGELLPSLVLLLQASHFDESSFISIRQPVSQYLCFSSLSIAENVILGYAGFQEESMCSMETAVTLCDLLTSLYEEDANSFAPKAPYFASELEKELCRQDRVLSLALILKVESWVSMLSLGKDQWVKAKMSELSKSRPSEFRQLPRKWKVEWEALAREATSKERLISVLKDVLNALRKKVG